MVSALREFIGSMAGVELAADGAPPTRFRIAAFGKNSTTHGPFELKREDAAAMVASAKSRPNIKLSADYDHAALHAGKGTEAPASAWYDLELGEDGLYAANVEWTPRALEKLKGREYRYFSPWFSQRPDGSVAAFKNFALTNRPAMDALTPLVASEDAQPPEPKMKTLLKHLALAEDASEAEALAKLQALHTERDAIFTATGAKDLPSAMAAIETAKRNAAKAGELQTKLTELEAQKVKGEKELLLADGVKTGKIPPALKDFWASQPVESLTAYLAAAPTLVTPAGTPGAPTQKDPKDQELALSDEEVEASKLMGIPVEKMTESKKSLLRSGA